MDQWQLSMAEQPVAPSTRACRFQMSFPAKVGFSLLDIQPRLSVVGRDTLLTTVNHHQPSSMIHHGKPLSVIASSIELASPKKLACDLILTGIAGAADSFWRANHYVEDPTKQVVSNGGITHNRWSQQRLRHGAGRTNEGSITPPIADSNMGYSNE